MPFSFNYNNSSGDEIAMQYAQKLPEFAEITQNYAITPFKVIQIESSYTIFY